jgi:hypothetical protein
VLALTIIDQLDRLCLDVFRVEMICDLIKIMMEEHATLLVRTR